MKNDLVQCLTMLDRIRDDQKIILEQQQKIISELADVKMRQKKIQQEMDGEGTPMELLVNRTGFLQ